MIPFNIIKMNKATFEIECINPEVVIKAIKVDDSSEVKYKIDSNKLIFEIEADSLSSLIKIAYSTCNRIQLSADTIKRFEKEAEKEI